MIFENLQLILTLMALSVSVSAHCMLTAVTQSKSRVVLSCMIYCVSLQNVTAVGNGKLNSLCHQQDQVLKARVKQRSYKRQPKLLIRVCNFIGHKTVSDNSRDPIKSSSLTGM